MKLLIDTQALLWFLGDSSKLSQKALAAISDQNNSLNVSIACFWEMAIKVSIKKLELPVSISELMSITVPSFRMEIQPLAAKHLEGLSRMPFHHKDPFDRAIVAQAECEGFSIVSSDEVLDLYGITRIW